jgi:hypothetical protein
MHEAVRAIDALDRPGSLKKTHLPYPSLSQRIIEIMIFVFPVDILLIRGPAFDEDGPGSRVRSVSVLILGYEPVCLFLYLYFPVFET